MRIEIEHPIDTETKDVYSFNTFDFTAVFIAWHREVKPKGKRKWTIEKYWDKYGRSNHITNEEPELPQFIRNEVFTKLTNFINVKTWSEWKQN